MSKSKKAEVPAEEVEKEIVSNVESADGVEVPESENPVQEEAIEEVPVEDNQQSSIDDDIAGGGPKNPPKKEEEENSIIINDGAEGDAGQDSLNEIEVDAEVFDSEKQSFLASAHIKSMNLLAELKHVRDADISFEKDEDLEVAIVYAEKAVESIEKLIE